MLAYMYSKEELWLLGSGPNPGASTLEVNSELA